MKRFIKTLTLALLALGSIAITNNASAVPIPTSELIGFQGSGSSSAVGGVTTLTFGAFHVVNTSGVFNAIPFNTPTTFSSFSFTGNFGSVSLLTPAIPLWSVPGYPAFSFNLTGLDSGFVSGTSFSINGSGLLFAPGYDPTTASFSINGVGGGGFNYTVEFASSASTGTQVPDGGATAALLGCAFIGLAYAKRRFSAAQA